MTWIRIIYVLTYMKLWTIWFHTGKAHFSAEISKPNWEKRHIYLLNIQFFFDHFHSKKNIINWREIAKMAVSRHILQHCDFEVTHTPHARTPSIGRPVVPQQGRGRISVLGPNRVLLAHRHPGQGRRKLFTWIQGGRGWVVICLA